MIPVEGYAIITLVPKRGQQFHLVGVDDGEGPPVPIPNTEVKLVRVDNTWLATAREDRKMPTQKERPPNRAVVFLRWLRLHACRGKAAKREKSNPQRERLDFSPFFILFAEPLEKWFGYIARSNTILARLSASSPPMALLYTSRIQSPEKPFFFI